MAHISICGLLSIVLLCFTVDPSFQVTGESIPSESECRPYIEKALNNNKVLKITDTLDNENAGAETLMNPTDATDDNNNSQENSEEKTDLDSNDAIVSDDIDVSDESNNVVPSTENDDNNININNSNEATNDSSRERDNAAAENEADTQTLNDEESEKSEENDADDNDNNNSVDEEDSHEQLDVDSKENTAGGDSQEQQEVDSEENTDGDLSMEQKDTDSKEFNDIDSSMEQKDSKENSNGDLEEQRELVDSEETDSDIKENGDAVYNEHSEIDSKENTEGDAQEQEEGEEEVESKEIADGDSKEQQGLDLKENTEDDSNEQPLADIDNSTEDVDGESKEVSTKSFPVDDLLMETRVPGNRRDRSHIDEILRLDENSLAQNEALQKTAEVTLNNLKKIYENAIKPLEALYKYRDLSNRHFGDSEVFSKPLVLFMGPWSGGKSSILNYLTDNEYTDHSLRTGAEPSPAYFNILMYGDSPEVLDGTQLAADWTFSGLQKFGQGLQDRLRGLKLPSNILKKVNIVEIPGILEVRKQVSRVFPFNDACQWFIDRADIIFLVYDPSKLDVGPETEAILDQLKGREYQTRILLNKADIIHPEELLRVQSALIWNISPLMSSAQPPAMYTTSLWSNPYQDTAPIRLLQAQEKALLQDLSQAIEHRIENKIASARRFAVRVRNHAKMVDCYLTTYYNHKTLFGNKKKISGEIVEHPQNYHIYEGLSTLTNISRYDLPDPEVYRDFFRLNPLYEFKKLSETCTYFRGCPINKLDVAIAYDLPELVNRYKRAKEQALNTLELDNVNDTSTTTKR